MAALDDLDLSGTLLRGRYLLVARFGKGGMGVVYAARDTELDRPIAIKVIRPEQAQAPAARELFRAEARILARLRHPNIVPVYDFGTETLGGATLLYLVMPYVGGGTLAERLRVAPLSYDETAKILAQVSSALDHAHTQRVLHRDLKPLNVLFDEGGAALVADFGLARLIDADSRAPALTYAGTPPYMAPEQLAMGEGSAATDVYALGMMLHEMLIGTVPPRMQDRDGLFIAKLDEALPGRVRAVLVRATHHKQEERYQRASELAAAFEAIEPARHDGRSAAGVAPADEVVVPAADGALEDAVRRVRPGTILRLGAGTHRLGRPLRIDKALWLLGAGTETTRVVGSGEGYVLRYEAQGRLVARDLTVAHEGTMPANAVEVAQGEADLESCAFTGAIKDEDGAGDPGGTGNGLVVRGKARGVVRHCVAGGNARAGIRVNDQARPDLEGNTCERNNSCGISYFGEGGGVARANTCAANLGHGIQVSERARPELVENTCRENGGTGIGYFGEGGGVARANICAANLDHGIWVGERARPELDRNTCRENETSGIGYFGEGGGVARANICAANSYGIWVSEWARPELERNDCSSNNSSGIGYNGEGGGVARANTCAGNTYQGIWVGERAHPELVENTCRGNGQYGIAVIAPSRARLGRNECANNVAGPIFSQL